MPVITIDTAALTREKKERLVEALTRNASEITGIAPEKFIVLINWNGTISASAGSCCPTS